MIGPSVPLPGGAFSDVAREVSTLGTGQAAPVEWTWQLVALVLLVLLLAVGQVAYATYLYRGARRG